MDPGQFLESLAQSGVHIRRNGDKLRVNSPRPLTDGQTRLITEHKPQLLTHLHRRHDPLADPMPGFRSWWWEVFDCGTGSTEYNAESAEAASGLLPILRNLTWPDFEARAEGPTLKLKRVCERHYPASDVPDAEA